MCDYSLAGLPNRLAAEGENLVVHRFSTGSMGLASPEDLLPCARPRRHGFRQWLAFAFEMLAGGSKVTAVCVPPGAHLFLKNIPEDLQRRWFVGSEEEAEFTQDGAIENSFRDAIRFFHGRRVLLQELPSGMPVKVLTLGGDVSGEGFDRFVEDAHSVLSQP